MKKIMQQIDLFIISQSFVQLKTIKQQYNLMKSSTSLMEQIMTKQSVRRAFLRKEGEIYNLNRNLNKKYSFRVDLIKNNNLRSQRFILSQRKILQRQNISMHKAKQIIELKQKKALSNKSYSMVEKSKRVEAGLAKWSRIVERNKDQDGSRIKDTIVLDSIEQLSHSSSKKSLYLNELSQRQKEKHLQRLKQYHSSREKTEQFRVNPESSRQSLQLKDRYISLAVHRQSSKKSLRLSTESLSDKRRQIEQSLLQRSLISIANKQEKINQARYIKLYVQERNKRQKEERSKVYQQIRSNHLSQIKIEAEERSHMLEQKFKNSRIKIRNKKSSLPQINGTGRSQLAMYNDPSELWRKKFDGFQETEQPFQPLKNEQSYDKLVRQKVKDVQNFIRKNKRC